MSADEISITNGHNHEEVKPSKKWTRCSIFVGLLAMEFFGYASYSVIAPFFPTEAQEKDVQQTVTGLIFSSYAFTVLLFAPVWGHQISRSGPKFYLVIGAIVCGLANLCFGWLTLINDHDAFVVACFVVRIAEGIGFSALATAVFATVARLHPKSLGTAMAVVRIAIGIGMGVGPSIGSALYELGGYPVPFEVLGGALLLTSIAVYFLITCTPFLDKDIFHSNKTAEGLTLWIYIKIPKALITMAAVFASSTALSVQIPTLAIHVQEIGIDGSQAGYLFTAQLTSYGLMALVAGKLSDKFPKRQFRTMIFGLVLISIGLIIIGPTPILTMMGVKLPNSLAGTLIALFILGAGGAFVAIPSYQVSLDSATEAGFRNNKSTHGIVGGAWNAAFTFGGIVGPAAGAALTDEFGYPLATTLTAALSFIFAVGMGLFLGWHSFGHRAGDEPSEAYYEATVEPALALTTRPVDAVIPAGSQKDIELITHI